MDQHQTNHDSSTLTARRSLMFATCSAIAMVCSAPLHAQAAPQSIPAGPTGVAQVQQGANPTPAPTPQSSADATTPSADNQIVVTGTRAAGRSRLDTAAPVAVLSSARLQHQGT